MPNPRLQKTIATLLFCGILLLSSRVISALHPPPPLILVPSAARFRVDGPDWPHASADRGGKIESIIDGSSHTWWYGQMPDQGPLFFTITPLEPLRIGAVSIESAEARQPTGLRLEVRRSGSTDWQLVTDWQIVTHEEQVMLTFPSALQTDITQLRFQVTSTTQPDKLVRINEVRFLEAIDPGTTLE